MRDRKELLKKSLEDTSKLFLEVNTDIVDFNTQINIVLNLLKDDKENNILRSKLCALIRYNVVTNDCIIREELKAIEDNFGIKISTTEYNKRANSNEIFAELFKNNRKLFDVYRDIIFKLNYKITTLYDIILFFDKYGVTEDLGADALCDIVNYHINNPKDTQSVTTSILKKSNVHRVCGYCNQLKHISEYMIGKPYCKTCSKNNVKDSDTVEDNTVVNEQPVIKKKELEKSIKEFKNNSRDAELNTKVSHSVNYVMLNSALNTIDMNVNSLGGIDISGLSYEESLDINIKIVELNKKLLNLEGEIYAKQKQCTD